MIQGWEFDLSIFLSFKKSESIPLTFKKDCQEQFELFHDQIDLSNTKNNRLDRKTVDQIPNPDHSTSWQGWELDLSMFWSMIFWSFRSFQKIDRDRIALIDLLKRSIVSESIPSIFKKDGLKIKWIPPDPDLQSQIKV